MKKVLSALLLLSLIGSCKPDLKTNGPAKGNADFSVYLAVGNSLTAGFADNSLYRSGQLNSYPLRLSEQFALVGGGYFSQPLLNSEGGYPRPKYILSLSLSCMGLNSLSPVLSGLFDTTGDGTSIASQGPYNNCGVPGIRCCDYLLPGYAFVASFLLQSPYAARFFSNPLGSPLDEALNVPATFFTCWLGSNDVLGYAANGGQGNAIAVPVTIPGIGSIIIPTDITPQDVFQTNYDSIINSLTKNGAKGALINIPDITSIPLFKTIPPNALLLTQVQADSLNQFYAGWGFSFNAGLNYFVVQDHDGVTRQAQAGELIMLTVPQDSLTCYGYGSYLSIPGQYVLTLDEVNAIKDATIAFNNIIYSAAQAHGLTYIDANSYLQTLSSGIVFNGVKLNADFVSGGVFSLDGVHLTPKGYALMANKIIEGINIQYSSSIPMIDVNKYSGIKFP